MSAPEYFDSQAQAATALDVPIDELRAAKRSGCEAFRSGRVYRAPLLEWLARNFKPRQQRASAAKSVPSWNAQDTRRGHLFALFDALEDAHSGGELADKEFAAIGSKTLEIVIRLGRLWDAGIDEAGYRQRWREIVGELKR
jgi:hypothetical protein